MSQLYVPRQTIGADVEFFFRDADGDIVPSDRVLPNKKNALILSLPDDDRDHVKDTEYDIDYDMPWMTLHVDGIQGELTVSPDGCRAYSIDKLRLGLMGADDVAKKNGLTLSLDTTVETPAELLATATPEGVAFGCDPDFGAWFDGDPNVKPFLDPAQHYLRYAGSHVHITTPWRKDADARQKTIQAVMLMDIFLGTRMVLIESNDSLVATRREMFGAAGCFRFTTYGLEYRVPSTNMLKHPFLYHWAYEMARFSVAMVEQGKFLEVADALGGNSESIINAINYNDSYLAWRVVKKTEMFLQNSDSARNAVAFANFYNQLMEGKISLNFRENWRLDDVRATEHARFSDDDRLPLDSYFFNENPDARICF